MMDNLITMSTMVLSMEVLSVQRDTENAPIE